MYVCIIESMRTRVPYHTTWTTSRGGVVAKWDCDDIATHARGYTQTDLVLTSPYTIQIAPAAAVTPNG